MNATSPESHTPWTVFFLCALLFFQGVGAVGGGVYLVVSPSGELMGMPLSQLDHSPFHNFLIPGMVLCVALGVLPLMLAYAVVKRPEW